jgi:hypothetical protein
MIRHLLVTITAAAVTASLLHAQNPPTVQAKVRLLAYIPDLQQDEAFAHDPTADASVAGVTAPIKSYLNHEFSTVPTKSRKIVFTTKADHGSINRPGELIGEATLPASGNSAIFVFLPGKPGDKAKSLVMALDDSKQAFPPGSYHITNISPQTVRLMLEKSNYDFVPGKAILIKDPPVRESNQSGMRAFIQKGDKWQPLSAGLWPHPGQGRNLALIFQNPETGNVELRGFDDVPPRDPVPGEGSAPENPNRPQ